MNTAIRYGLVCLAAVLFATACNDSTTINPPEGSDADVPIGQTNRAAVVVNAGGSGVRQATTIEQIGQAIDNGIIVISADGSNINQTIYIYQGPAFDEPTE